MSTIVNRWPGVCDLHSGVIRSSHVDVLSCKCYREGGGEDYSSGNIVYMVMLVHVVDTSRDFFFSFLIVCFTSYFVFRMAVLPHSPGVVYYHQLLRRGTRIPGVAPFCFRIGIWDIFVHRGQKSYTPTAFGKLWTTPGVRCMKHASVYCTK